MISLELLNEFIDTVNNKKCVSKQLLKKIILNEIEQSGIITKNNFNDILFDKLPERHALGSFEKDDGIIIIDYDKMLHNYNKSIKECMQDIFVYNIGFLQAALHEVEHLKELSKSKNNNFEGLLINLSSIEIIVNYFESKIGKLNNLLSKETIELITDFLSFRQYKRLYTITPNERLADIYSYKNIFESFNCFPNFDKDLLQLLYNSLIFEYHNSYKINSDSYSPTIEYLKKLKRLLNHENVDFNDLILKFYMLYNKQVESFTLEEKMRYGLPIPFEDRKEIRKVLTINYKDFVL